MALEGRRLLLNKVFDSYTLERYQQKSSLFNKAFFVDLQQLQNIVSLYHPLYKGFSKTNFRRSQYSQIHTSEFASPFSVHGQNGQISVQELKISEFESNHYHNLYMCQISFTSTDASFSRSFSNILKILCISNTIQRQT